MIYETVFRKAMNEHEVQHFEAPGIRKTQHGFDFSVYPSDDTISIFWSRLHSFKVGNTRIRLFKGCPFLIYKNFINC